MIDKTKILLGIGSLIFGIYVLRSTNKMNVAEDDILLVKAKGYFSGIGFIIIGIYILVTELRRLINGY